MNSIVRNALARLVGSSDEVAEELRGLLNKANANPSVSRARTIRREDAPNPSPNQMAAAENAAPTPEEVAPEAAKEIVVDEALMGQIVAALTMDEAFMTKLATKVSDLTEVPEAAEAPTEPPMTEQTGTEVMQALKDLERALSSMVAEEGNVAKSRSRDYDSGLLARKTLASRAESTLTKLKAGK